MAATTKKVGGGKKGSKAQTTGAGDAAEPKGRAIYDFSKAQGLNAETGELESILDENGLLTAIPQTIPGEGEGAEPIQVGFDPYKNKPLTKKDFASEAVFLAFRAANLRSRVAKMTTLASDLERRAVTLGKFRSEKARKKAAKLDRMRKQMAALEAELSSEGVEVEADDTTDSAEA